MGGSGKITTEYTVWCSKCYRWYQTGEHRTKKDFAKFIRTLGWKYTSDEGWVCWEHKHGR